MRTLYSAHASAPQAACVQVLYVREHVFVWPNKRSRIMGRLSLTLQRHVLFIAWLPYSPSAVHAVRSGSNCVRRLFPVAGCSKLFSSPRTIVPCLCWGENSRIPRGVVWEQEPQSG